MQSKNYIYDVIIYYKQIIDITYELIKKSPTFVKDRYCT